MPGHRGQHSRHRDICTHKYTCIYISVIVQQIDKMDKEMYSICKMDKDIYFCNWLTGQQNRKKFCKY